MINNALYYNKFRLDGKVAIITGGTGLLGKNFCKGLAELGAKLVIVDLDEQDVYNFSREITENFDTEAIGIACDVSCKESVNNMVEKAIKHFSEIHILHNNAASKSSDLSKFFAPFEDYSLEQWKEIMSVNIDGMFLVAQAVGKQMVKQGKGGAIIQTSSIYGVIGPDNRIYEGSYYLGGKINTPAVYSASKAAVVGLTKYLATYWADKNIRVNTITPGGVESGQNEQFKSNYANRVPLGRMATSDEMVGALLYLASDASSYVTGQNIIVDGGITVW